MQAIIELLDIKTKLILSLMPITYTIVQVGNFDLVEKYGLLGGLFLLVGALYREIHRKEGLFLQQLQNLKDKHEEEKKLLIEQKEKVTTSYIEYLREQLKKQEEA